MKLLDFIDDALGSFELDAVMINDKESTKRVVVRNAVTRKPDHFYYIDIHGNLCECRQYHSRLNLWELIRCYWIDFLRLFKKNKRV